MGRGGQRGNVLRSLDQPVFRGIGQSERLRQNLMLAVDEGGQSFLECGEGDPSAVTGQGDDLRAAGEELRGTAFIGVDVCLFVSQHAAEGIDHGRQGQSIGGGTGGDEKDLRLGMSEHLADAFHCAGGERVAAVGHGRAFVGFGDGGHDAWMDGADVVAGEIHLSGSFGTGHTALAPVPLPCHETSVPAAIRHLCTACLRGRFLA